MSSRLRFAGLACLGLLGALALAAAISPPSLFLPPLPEPPVSASAPPRPTAGTEAVSAGERAVAPPEIIYSLFRPSAKALPSKALSGERQASPSPAASPSPQPSPRPTPVVRADWIRFTGQIGDQYYFMDSRRGRVMVLDKDQSDAEETIVFEGDTSFRLRIGDVLYDVEKRR